MSNQKKKPQNKKHLGGRPTDYTIQKAELICEQIATTSLSLLDICQMWEKDLPHHATVRRWILKYPEFRDNYARAKILQADILAEECVLISDNTTPEMVNVARLRIDTRKWLASKLLPKQYGDHRLLEEKIDENEKLKVELLELRAVLDARNQKEF